MSLLASLAILPAVLLPQGDQTPATPAATQAKPALLQPAEQASLRTKLVKYLEADTVFLLAEGSKDREKAAGKREKAKEAWQEAWDAAKKKHNLLASMTDLRAIYHNCFVVKAPTFSLATLRKETVKDAESGTSYDYSIWLPKLYKAAEPWRAVVVLPGTTAADQASAWVEGREYFKQVWDKAALLNDSIVHVCHLPNGLEMDPMPDYSREGQEAEEQRRIDAIFRTFLRETVAQTANVDRGRIFLDCARGNCGFGLRLASMFPDRFAGIVLRSPVAVDDLRLGSLLGIPILMLKTAATETAIDGLKKRLEEVSPGSVTVLDTTDEYPHLAAAAGIEAWMANKQRNMVPQRVVIEPNHDRFNRAYWVRMGRTDPLHTSPADKKARIEVQADPANNRLVVTARGVENFTLLLNDELVDLDKPFTVVINEKAVGPETRVRDASGLQKRVRERVDWQFLFPVEFNCTVPKAAEKPDEKKGNEPQPDEKK